MPLESKPNQGSRNENSFSAFLGKPIPELVATLEDNTNKIGHIDEQITELDADIAEIEALLREIRNKEILANFEETVDGLKEAGKLVGKGAKKAGEIIGDGAIKAKQIGKDIAVGGLVLGISSIAHTPKDHTPGTGTPGTPSRKGAQTEQTTITPKKDTAAQTTAPVDTTKTLNYVPGVTRNTDTFAKLNTTPQKNIETNIPNDILHLHPVTIEIPKIQTPAPAHVPILTPEERFGPSKLPTGLPETPITTPENIRGKKPNHITVETDTTAKVPSSGIPVEWKLPGIPTTPTQSTENKTPPVKSGEMKFVPASPGHPDPKIIDPRVWPTSEGRSTIINPQESADDDSTTMEINEYERQQDLSHRKIDTIIGKGAEKFAADPNQWGSGHTRFTLTQSAPGYHVVRIHGYPNQDEIDAFAAPSGKKIRMPDPEVRTTSTGLTVSRKFSENCDPKIFDKFEKDPVEFENYLHNQAQSKSIGAYVMESKGKLYAIGKDGMLLFEIPAQATGAPLGRSFVKLVKDKGDMAGHLEIDGKPLHVSKMEMEQLIKNCIPQGDAKGEKGFYYYGVPNNDEAYKSGKNRETVVQHINRLSGGVEQTTLGKLHDEEQSVLKAWQMNENHFVTFHKTTQEYHAPDGQAFETHEGIEREHSAHMRRKVKTVTEKISKDSPRESDFNKGSKKTERAPDRAAKGKK